MSDILKAELRRFLGWSLAYAAIHTMILAFLSRVADLAQQPDEVYLAYGTPLVLSGLLLGLHQMGGYRRPNAWLNLLHRPLATWRIAAGLLGAGALLLAIGVLLPLLAAAAWQEFMTPRVLDQRHVLLCVSAFAWTLAGYLTGAAVMLVPRRAALAPLAFVLLLPGAYAAGVGALVLQGLVIGWLLALVVVAFKPDLESLPRGAGVVLLVLPMQLMMWLLLVLAGFAFELLWIAQGSHPNNQPDPPAGSAKEADNAEGAALISAGLAGSANPDAPLWREQAGISDIDTYGLAIPRTPLWHELTNRAPMEVDDSERRIRWVFSHDAGHFIGRDITNDQPAGVLAVEGEGRFRSPPLPGPGSLLVGRHDVYQFDRDSQRVLPRVRVSDDEVIAGAYLSGERLAVLTHRALYVYDARPLRLDDSLLETRQRMPLPGPVGNLQRIDAMALFDGHLVSFTFTRRRHTGLGDSYQALLRVDEAGRVEPVAKRELPSGYGPIYRWQGWWMSPVIGETLALRRVLFTPLQPEFVLAPPPKPAPVLGLALGLMLLSLLAAVWRVRQTDLSPRARAAWCVSCAVVGLPGLMALWRLVALPELAASRAAPLSVAKRGLPS